MFPELSKKFNIPALTIGAYLLALDEIQMKKARGLAKGAKVRRIRHVPYDKTIDTYAGVRSTIDKKDFYIHPSLEKKNFIHVAKTDSPGVYAAPVKPNILSKRFLRRMKHSPGKRMPTRLSKNSRFQ